jgi:hypothetical protein
MAIYTEWASPAQVGEWALDVDDRKRPTTAILWRNDLEVVRLPYRAEANELVESLLKSATISRNSARKLATQLAAKCASPKVG